ncbi:MAG: XRE family transcriptional regulator [Rhizobiaceae bacterium]|nr:XRE family transcriptional regulator [Rhizobiaceae bacterium]
MSVVATDNLYSVAENVHSVGNDIRALRKSRSMTLVEFAETIDRSVGFVSQIERGISEPSISDLRNIAKLFDVPLSFFFGDNPGSEEEYRHIVRADHRRKLGNPEEGLLEELLSPDLGGTFEIIHSEFAPGARLATPQQRDTEEAGYIISGQLDLELDGVWHTLKTGDSFRFSGEAYRWRNTTNKPTIVIWVVSPPVY